MKILSIFLLTMLFGCENNSYFDFNGDKGKSPYPDTENHRTSRRQADLPVDEALGMIVSQTYEFYEGKRKDFKIKVTVPAPGVPEVWVENLPAGAKFDKETLTVSWKPGMFDGNKPGDPTIKTRMYPITVWLKSSIGVRKVLDKSVILEVYDVPQNLELDIEAVGSVSEGRTLSYDLEISNKDYPQGPFKVTAEGVPGNTEIKKITETKYQLVFSPDHHHVKINEQDDCSSAWGSVNCLKHKGKITVFNPANHISDKEIVIKVIDKRLEPKIVVPDNMEQGLDTTFQVSAFDLNGEVAPSIELESPEPEYGEFEYKIIRDENNNSSVLNITWKDIPPSHNGKSFKFEFEACTLSAKKVMNHCVTNSTYITIKVKERKPPVIHRDSWAAGEIKYLDFDEGERYSIQVAAGGDSWDEIKNVKIFPEEMREFVSWSRGTLRVRFKKAGIHQFSLVARSEYNVTSAESFVAEVFNSERTRTLYFTDSTRDEEVKFYRDTMGKVQLMNPVLQVLNERTLSGRDTLILGTGILKDPTLKLDIERAMGLIRNVVVASPLINNMPQKFIDELQQDFHISILGRYLNLPDMQPLSSMHFVAREDFSTTNDYVRLREKSTTESSNPMIFSVGVDRVNCDDVLDLTDQKDEARLKIGIICKRRNGGRFAILGTEFSDLKVSENDKNIPAQWFKKMLNVSINSKEVK